MKEFRVIWQARPKNHNQPRVLFVKAETAAEARTAAINEVERTYGVVHQGWPGGFAIEEVTEVPRAALSLADGFMSDTVPTVFMSDGGTAYVLDGTRWFKLYANDVTELEPGAVKVVRCYDHDLLAINGSLLSPIRAELQKAVIENYYRLLS